jgi:hypothetical protein
MVDSLDQKKGGRFLLFAHLSLQGKALKINGLEEICITLNNCIDTAVYACCIRISWFIAFSSSKKNRTRLQTKAATESLVRISMQCFPNPFQRCFSL